MGMFSFFRSRSKGLKSTGLDGYIKKFKNTDSAPGWDSIDKALKKIYPIQEPKHYAATPHYSVGGDDPLDGISIYKAQLNGEEYFHIITYGFSELYYDEEAFGGDYSKFGFELTIRVKPFKLDDEYPFWALNMLQNIARYVFKSGNWFEQYHYMPANGPLREGCDTELTALAFVTDPELGSIKTLHGEVQFLQIFGLNDFEFNEIKSSGETAENVIEQHRLKNPLLITDLERKSKQ